MNRKMPQAWPAVCLLCLFAPWQVCRAAEPAAEGTVAEELANLRAEVARLKAENAELKKALVSGGSTKSGGYQSIVDILNFLPGGIRPESGWDKVSLEKLASWLRKELVGQPFEAEMVVTRVSVNKEPFSTTKDRNWSVRVFFETRNMTAHGLVLMQNVGDTWPQPLKLYGDDEYASKMEKFSGPKRAIVKGKIKSIYLGPEMKGSRSCHIGLTDYSLVMKK